MQSILKGKRASPPRSPQSINVFLCSIMFFGTHFSNIVKFKIINKRDSRKIEVIIYFSLKYF